MALLYPGGYVFVTKRSIKEELFIARHMNGRLEEVEEGQAEIKVVYEKEHRTFIWEISIFHESFTDFVPLDIHIAEKEQPAFMATIRKMIDKRENIIPLPKRIETDPNPAA